MSSTPEEARLVRRLKRRDEAAFAEMVTTYQDRVFAIVYRMLGDRGEAEDLAQEVFITVFKRIDQFRGEAKFSTWLYRIATNHTKNRIKYLARRHHQRTKPLGPQEDGTFVNAVAPKGARPDEVYDGVEMEAVVKRALAAIDPAHREVIVLRDLEHMSYQDIADVLGVAQGTVKSRLFRARAALQQFIKAEYAS